MIDEIDGQQCSHPLLLSDKTSPYHSGVTIRVPENVHNFSFDTAFSNGEAVGVVRLLFGEDCLYHGDLRPVAQFEVAPCTQVKMGSLRDFNPLGLPELS